MAVSEIIPQPGAEDSSNAALISVADSSGGVGRFSRVELEDCTRLAVLAAPKNLADFETQSREIITGLQHALQSQPVPMRLASQTVFLRDPADEPTFRELVRSNFDSAVTTFVHQPPCGGAAVALEAWAVGGSEVSLEHFGENAVSWHHAGTRWVRCGGISVPDHPEGVYAQSCMAMQRMRRSLQEARMDLEDVVRTWFYLGAITGPEGETQRYKELNRARTDFYETIRFQSKLLGPACNGIYPASTGIGMTDRKLSAGCLALQTDRKDVRLVALENPSQTPAYAYNERYSPKSPKFSRAMALALGHWATTWISGTASIVNSESLYVNDPVRQTEQTIDNIEQLIAKENFAAHGLTNTGATLRDLAKVRVYVKRSEDFEAVRRVCTRRFGPVPALYVIADVCRPELLVEIEGVAFSRIAPLDR